MDWHTSIDGKLSNLSYGFRFGGQIYHNFSAGSDSESRFETSTFLLRDFVINCTGQDMALGDSSNQSFVLTTDSTWDGTLLDLSSLYFKNSSTNTTGYLAILGTKE